MTTDEMSLRLRREAEEALRDEPELCALLHKTVLAKGVETFEDAVASTVCYRLMMLDKKTDFCPTALKRIVADALESPALEGDHTMAHAVREDALACCRRDPACETLLEVVLFYKGYAALVCHRAARRKWYAREGKRSFTALFLQSQASAVFGVDCHPAATIGAGILFDHGTGIVIGETAHIGDGSTLLHGVTLGGTGKVGGDRHPKVGKRVLIGAGSTILGNIVIGDGAKIGAGSVVLRPIPAGATAVGAPAKIIGRAMESDPGSEMDDTLQNVALLHKSASLVTMTPSTSVSSDLTDDDADETSTNCMCPFRGYEKMTKGAPQDAVTWASIKKLMLLEGCTETECGQVFFQLDTKNVGYVHLDEFKKRGEEILSRFTSITPERMHELVTNFQLKD
mmetsp:Transcript_4694/g.7808  ORF Transcript_4694/g.7808 Transcript_4694/m.7808 type:complete len:397 (-) Transcript_4694:481-1671(-)